MIGCLRTSIAIAAGLVEGLGHAHEELAEWTESVLLDHIVGFATLLPFLTAVETLVDIVAQGTLVFQHYRGREREREREREGERLILHK